MWILIAFFLLYTTSDWQKNWIFRVFRGKTYRETLTPKRKITISSMGFLDLTSTKFKETKGLLAKKKDWGMFREYKNEPDVQDFFAQKPPTKKLSQQPKGSRLTVFFARTKTDKVFFVDLLPLQLTEDWQRLLNKAHFLKFVWEKVGKNSITSRSINNLIDLRYPATVDVCYWKLRKLLSK